MKAEWEPDELIEAWTLTGDGWGLVGNKSGVTRLGFTVMLKFYEIEGRFPAYPEEVPPAAVRYLASLVKVDPVLFAKYPWKGRSISTTGRRSAGCTGHGGRPRMTRSGGRSGWPRRSARRRRTGTAWPTRWCGAAGARRWSRRPSARWSASSHRAAAGSTTPSPRRPPGGSARWCAAGCKNCCRGRSVLAELKSDPGPLGLDTLLAEIGKLATVRALGLDEEAFAAASDRIVAAWRARAARMYPSDFEDCGLPVRYTLLAALCWTRQAELVDGLVELLIGLIHRINARAERRVEKELIGELANVPGKRGIFTRMVDAALEHPDDTVRDALYPVVPGGVKTLSALARELKATERAVAERVRYQLRGSYSHYYRRMLAPLLAALEFRCNNSAYRPVMDAIDLLARYAGDRQRPEALRGRGEGAGRRGGAEGVAGRRRRRRRPGRAHPVRAVRADRAAGRAAPPRGLRPGRGPLEGPGRGPAGRLRGQPRRPLLRARQAPGRRRVHRRPSQAPGRRRSPGSTRPWPGAPAAGSGSSPGRAARG